MFGKIQAMPKRLRALTCAEFAYVKFIEQVRRAVPRFKAAAILAVDAAAFGGRVCGRRDIGLIILRRGVKRILPRPNLARRALLSIFYVSKLLELGALRRRKRRNLRRGDPNASGFALPS
jgi:hypothetical protein